MAIVGGESLSCKSFVSTTLMIYVIRNGVDGSRTDTFFFVSQGLELITKGLGSFGWIPELLTKRSAVLTTASHQD